MMGMPNRHPFLLRLMKITSAANPRVQAAARLRNSRTRTLQARFMINGVREISRALDGGLKLQEVFTCPDHCDGSECRELLPRLVNSGAAHFEVSPSVFSILAYGSRDEGVLAVAE